MKKNNVVNKSIMYNTIGSFVYLFCQWLITFAVVWLSGYKTAGILSIAMSVSTTFCVIATFNMRNYQASDLNGKYDEKTYIKSRIYTCIIAIIVTFLYSLFKNFGLFQFMCINIYMIFKISEAIVDVIHGSLQKKWKFNLIGYSYFFRGLISITVFCLALYITKNLLITLVLMTLCVYIFILFYDIMNYKKEFKNLGNTNNKIIISLLINCIPLVIYGVIFSYVSMFPRVITENLYGSEQLGYYASVATPALIVQVAASFIFTPLISLFSEMYKSKKYLELKKLVTKIMLGIIILCLVCLVGSYFFKDLVLRLLFTSSILPYTYLFYGVIIISSLTAIVWLLGTILIIARNYYAILFGSFISYIIVLLISNSMIEKFGLNGINLIGLIVLLSQTFIYLIYVFKLNEKCLNNVYYVRSTSIINDSRASKEIYSLSKNNYNIKVLGWDRDSRLKGSKSIDINEIKVKSKFFKFKAGYGSSKKNIFGLMLFQVWEFVILLKDCNKYNCIHACDFDCGFIALIVSKLCNKKLVYDMYDYYTDSRPMPKSIEKLVNKLENSVINNADLSIICGEWRKKQIIHSSPKKLIVIHNTPNVTFASNKKIMKSKSKKLKIVYVGILQNDRLLLEILQQFKLNQDYELHIGGFGMYEKDFENASKNYKNIFYYGSMKYSDVLNLEKDCDVLFATYNPTIKNHKYSAPNKVYEAMALKKPIIVCKNTGIDELIKKNKNGLCIDYSGESFIETIRKLSNDKKLIDSMIKNSERAYKSKYNWDVMENRLIDSYSTIIKEKQ